MSLEYQLTYQRFLSLHQVFYTFFYIYIFTPHTINILCMIAYRNILCFAIIYDCCVEIVCLHGNIDMCYHTNG